MKKFIAITSILLLSCLALFAKGQKEEVSHEATSDGTIELTWFSHYPTDIVQPAIDAYEKENPKIKINYEIGVQGDSQETLKKLDLMLLGGKKCDIMLIPGAEGFVSRANSGTFLSLNDCFAQEGKKYSDYYDYDDAINGNHYGLSSQLTFWYTLINQDYLDEAGLPKPSLDWTWDDFEKYALAMTKGEGSKKRYGAYIHTFPDLMKIASYNVLDNNGIYDEHMKPNYDAPVFKGFLEYLNRLENVEGCVMPYADAKATKAHYNNFFSGAFGMTVIGSWTLSPTSMASTGKFPHSFVTTFAPLPRWKDGGTTGKTYAGLEYLAVNAKSAHPQEAFDFILWLATKGGLYEEQLRASKMNNNEEVVKNLLKDSADVVDEESLLNVMNNRIDNPSIRSDKNMTKLSDLFTEQAELYLVGGQDIDTTMDTIIHKSNAMYE